MLVTFFTGVRHRRPVHRVFPYGCCSFLGRRLPPYCWFQSNPNGAALRFRLTLDMGLLLANCAHSHMAWSASLPNKRAAIHPQGRDVPCGRGRRRRGGPAVSDCYQSEWLGGNSCAIPILAYAALSVCQGSPTI